MNKHNVKKLPGAALLLAMLLLSACAASSTPSTSVICPPPVEIPDLPPSLQKPPPQESFLEAAQKDIEGWLQQLTASGTR